MPTSGEAQIRPTSSYNLSHIPVPVRTTPLTKGKPTETKGSTGSRSKTRVRTVPDFAKLHKSWQQSFNERKACSKKQCTQVQEFDLTKPGTVFHPKYYDDKLAHLGDDEEGEEDVFQTDDDALQSILNAGLPTASRQDGRFTMAGCGISGDAQPKPTRQTLGAMPSTYQGRANNTRNTGNQCSMRIRGHSTKPGNPNDLVDPLESEQHKSASSRKFSLAEQQQGININFETDAGALASILNNTGANFHRQAPTTRQTIGVAMGAGRNQGSMFSGRQSQGPVRTSIYYQRPRNMNFNRVFTDYANHVLSRLSLAENVVPSSGSQPLEQLTKANMARASFVAQPGSKAGSQSRLLMSAPRRMMRTPVTVGRILNPRYQASLSGHDVTSSPALRAPPSAMKKANTHKEGKAQFVKWADVLSPPGERTAAVSGKDGLATTLFADEDTHFMEPHSMNQVIVDQGQLQAACVIAKQDEIQQLEQQAALHRNKLVEMDEIERQLELEIQKLQQEDSLPSPPTMASKDQTGTDSQSNRKLNPLYPDTPVTQPVPQHTLEKAPNDGSVQTPLKACSSISDKDLSPRNMNSEAGETMYRPKDMRPENSTAAEVFIHSQGSPFQRNHLREEVDFGLSKPSATQPESISGSDNKTAYDSTSHDTSEMCHRNPEKQFQTFEIPQKLFAEVKRDHFVNHVNEAKYPNESQEPRILYPRSHNYKMQSLQELSNNRNLMVNRIEYTQQCSEAVNIWQPPSIPGGRSAMTETQGLPQEPPKMPSEHLGQNANSFDASHQLVGTRQDHQSATRTDISQSGDVMTDNQTREPFCSLPHNLPQNHNVADQGSKREEVLSNRIASTQERPTMSHVYGSSLCSSSDYRANSLFRSGPPNSSINPGFSVQQNRTNPQVQINIKMSDNLETPSRDALSSRGIPSTEFIRQPFMSTSKELNPQIPHDHLASWLSSTPVVKPRSMIKDLTLKHSLPSSNLPGNKPPIHTPLAMRTMSMWNRDDELGASPVQFVSPIALRSGQASYNELEQTKTTDFNPLLKQSGLLGDPTSATTFTATSTVDLRPPHQPQLGVMIDPLLSSTATDTEQNNNGPHSLGEQLRSSHLKSKGKGSLSLGAELMTSVGAAAFLKNKMKPLLTNTTNQLFQEALLDEECALYACRLPRKFNHIAEDRLCFNPVAKILMDGDDMHFVPIQSKGRVYISSPIGSAFNKYSELSGV